MEMTRLIPMKKLAASTSISKLVAQEELQMQTVVLQRSYSILLSNMQPENHQKVTWNGHGTGQESDGHQASCAIQEVRTTSYPSTYSRKVIPRQ